MDNNEATPFKSAMAASAAGDEPVLVQYHACTDDLADIGYEAAHPALQASLWCEAPSAVPDGRDWQ